MFSLRLGRIGEEALAMEIIAMAKAHLKQQGIDQWQTGYPDLPCIKRDMACGKGYFIVENGSVLGYLCVDFGGEPAYKALQGEWQTTEPYVVVHRLAFADSARGKGISQKAFQLVEQLSKGKGIRSFRVDTDADNSKMRYILAKCGFTYRGKIWFDNSEKIAFDKVIE